MARRMVAPMAGGLVIGLVLGMSGIVGGQSEAPRGDLTVVERAATDTVVDLGETGDSIGDLLMFGNDLYDATNATVIGRDEGTCFRTNPGLAWECTWTNLLADGSITVQGPFPDSLADSELAITGGTGAYADAGGTMTLHSRDETGTEFDFTFHLGS
jgi:allene oxide cyclase